MRKLLTLFVALVLCLVGASSASASTNVPLPAFGPLSSQGLHGLTVDADQGGGPIASASSFSNTVAWGGDTGYNNNVYYSYLFWGGYGCSAWGTYMSTINPTNVAGAATRSNCVSAAFYMDREFYNSNSYWRHQGNRRAKLKYCALIIHEMGHIAGWWDGVGDPNHSENPNSIMYGALNVDNLAQVPDVCEQNY
jgi:hypothetical protein